MILTRRDFIRNAAAVIAAPVYIPIERLDKLFIPVRRNRFLTPDQVAAAALDILNDKLRADDIFTVGGIHRVDEFGEDSGQLQQFIVQDESIEIYTGVGAKEPLLTIHADQTVAFRPGVIDPAGYLKLP